MRTRIVMHHSSESPAKVREIVKRLEKIGFNTSLGAYDYQYDWKRDDVTENEVLDLVDKVTEVLRGTHCWFHFVTIPDK